MCSTIKAEQFVTMATYWIPDLDHIKGFSRHLWHSILIFADGTSVMCNIQKPCLLGNSCEHVI